jgi:hypothetical protein
VAVAIDESRCHEQAGGIDGLSTTPTRELSHCDNSIPVDS